MIYFNSAILTLVLGMSQTQAIINYPDFMGYRQPLLGSLPPQYDSGRSFSGRESGYYPWRPEMYNRNAVTMNLLRSTKGTPDSAKITSSSSKIFSPVTTNSNMLPVIKSSPTSDQLYGDSGTKPVATTNRPKTVASTGASILRGKYLGKFQLPHDVSTENVIYGINILSKMSEMLGKSTDNTQVVSTASTKKNPGRELWKMLERIGSLKSRSSSIGKHNNMIQPTKSVTIFTVLVTTTLMAKNTPPTTLLVLPSPTKIATLASPIKQQLTPSSTSGFKVNNYWSQYGIDTNILSLASDRRPLHRSRAYQRTQAEPNI